MGYGDEIMAAGQAQKIHRETGQKISIVGVDMKPRWSEIWRGLPEILNPAIGSPGPSAYILKNGPFCRPYIDRWGTEDGRPKAHYSSWRARDHRAKLQLSSAQRVFRDRTVEEHGDYIVLEHRLKKGASPNKDWGRDRWQQVAYEPMGSHSFLQIGSTRDLLDGPIFESTPSFEAAAAVIAGAALYVGVEGGLHHAAAAFGIPAVVIFGHFTSAGTTGYEDHMNMGGAGAGCGRWAPCQVCREELDLIEPSMVVDLITHLMKKREGSTWAH